MPDLDDQGTDVSDVYDDVDDVKLSNILEEELSEEKSIQEDVSLISPPPCLPLITDCNLPTSSANLLDRNMKRKNKDLLSSDNKSSPEMPVIISSPTIIAMIEKPSGDNETALGIRCSSPVTLYEVPKSVLKTELSRHSLGQLCLKPPRPEIEVTSPLSRE